MMNEPDKDDTRLTDESDQIDHGVEQLICDAYDAPTLPASLLQRLDLQIKQEWGHSPGLVSKRPHTSWLPKLLTGRWPGVARIVACATLVLGAILMLGRGAPAYDWSSVVRAIEQKGIVQWTSPAAQRWLSLSEGVLGERTDSSVTLVDCRQYVVLKRSPDDTQVRRYKLSDRLSSTDRDHLVLAFLTGNTSSNESLQLTTGARLIKQNWEHSATDNRKMISLNTRWENERKEQFGLRLLIDPVTFLPITCEPIGAGTESALQLSYSTERVADRRASDFPAEYPFVDVDSSGEASVIATVGESSNTRGNSNRKERDSPATGIRTLSASPTLLAASGWKPAEPTPRSQKEVVAEIDLILKNMWETNQVEPAPAADDEELLRRVYLDLCGRTPTVHELRSYLTDQSPDRYERLVDRLLKHRDHSSHLATVWRSFLIPEGVDLTAFGGFDGFDRWLAERFGRNEPYDSTVRGLLLAEGRLSRSGPLLFYSAAKLDPDLLAARTARVFLGMRLECAQCHDHPFEPWKQEEFWGFAAFFSQISRPKGDLRAASTVMQVRDVDHGDVKLPKTEIVVQPHFLNGENVAVRLDDQQQAVQESRRQQLARWITSPQNPYFSRATANRVWSMMFGKGIVDPVDDFGVRHQPKSPELLELLAGHFAYTNFDLRELFRSIALSRAYRLSSGAPTADPARWEWFAQMNVKTLSAEQVYDCIAVATLIEATPAGDPFAFNIARSGNMDRDSFIRQFRTPSGRSTEYLGGIPQALTLMNGGLIDVATGLPKSGLLKSLDAPFFTNQQRVEVLYLAVLSRRPRPNEWELLKQLVSNDKPVGERKESLSDILWALLNSAEFTMNH